MPGLRELGGESDLLAGLVGRLSLGCQGFTPTLVPGGMQQLLVGGQQPGSSGAKIRRGCTAGPGWAGDAQLNYQYQQTQWSKYPARSWAELPNINQLKMFLQ